MAGKLGSKRKRKKFKYLLERDGTGCHYCGVELTASNRSIDHILPQSVGGTNANENLVLACKPCNTRRQSTDYEEWKLFIRNICG